MLSSEFFCGSSVAWRAIFFHMTIYLLWTTTDAFLLPRCPSTELMHSEYSQRNSCDYKFSASPDNESPLSSIDDTSPKNDARKRRSFRESVRKLTRRIVTRRRNNVTSFESDSTLASSSETVANVEKPILPQEEAQQTIEEIENSCIGVIEGLRMEPSKPVDDNKLDEIQETIPIDESTSYSYKDLSGLSFEDIDYESSEMAPPFLDSSSCLMPDAEPVVRIEKAPENSRRIFAGIDILASADDVWNILTDYGNLQNVIPNLVVNDVLELYDGDNERIGEMDDENLPEEVRCESLSRSMKGSLLKQIGGAKVAGIQFSAKTTLEVREWPNGMPDYAHFLDDLWEGKSREDRAKEYPQIKLKRYRFPRPFAVSDLPTRDISMQSIAQDDGEFRLYQGVWRMQPLVGCSPPGQDAMRLTYAVEISPRPYLPVRLVEGRIVQDLCANLEAIRQVVTQSEESLVK